MGTAEHLALAGTLISSREQLLAAGRTSKGIQRAVRLGELLRIRRGWYAVRDDWANQRIEARHLARMIATARVNRCRTVFSHVSAAAVHGLPLYRYQGKRVHVVEPMDSRNRNTARVVRHRAALDESELCRLGSLHATSLEQTMLDVARFEPIELAVSCVNAGARSAKDDRSSREAWVASLADIVAEQPGVTGNDKARLALKFADPSAESPLESVSLLYLRVLGFEVRTQLEVTGSNGKRYRIDFDLPEHGVYGEVDGAVKYTDERILRGRTTAEAVLDEKHRHDAISNASGKRIIRWGAAELSSLESFARYLAGCGIYPPAVPQRVRFMQ